MKVLDYVDLLNYNMQDIKLIEKFNEISSEKINMYQRRMKIKKILNEIQNR